MFLFIKYAPKKLSLLTFSRRLDQSFHVIQIFFQGAPTRGRKAILSFGNPAGEGFRASDIAGILQLSRVHAQDAVRRASHLLQLLERQKSMYNGRAYDSEPCALVDPPIEIRRGTHRGSRARHS